MTYTWCILGNLLAQRMQLFDPKDFALFFCSLHGGNESMLTAQQYTLCSFYLKFLFFWVDILMNDSSHFEKFLSVSASLTLPTAPKEGVMSSSINLERTTKKSRKFGSLSKLSVSAPGDVQEMRSKAQTMSAALDSEDPFREQQRVPLSRHVFIYRRNSANFLRADDLIEHFFESSNDLFWTGLFFVNILILNYYFDLCIIQTKWYTVFFLLMISQLTNQLD